MKNYQWILFDADDTLFHFDSLSGLRQMFKQFGVDFSAKDYADYQKINQPLWIDYQNGVINAQELQHRRFCDWADKLAIPSETLSLAFLKTMAAICHPMEGARELLHFLKDKIRLGIITNGFIELQQARLERTGLSDFFELVVISEQVGVAKPHRGIFAHALQRMGHPHPSEVLMVGDNPTSDILGGLHAGLDTCWFNARQQSLPVEIIPHYQVTSLAQLHTRLEKAIDPTGL